MSSFVIELDEKEIDNICLALVHATLKNKNKDAVEDFNNVCEKLIRYAGDSTKIAIKMLKMIEGENEK